MSPSELDRLKSWRENSDKLGRNQGAVKVACAIAAREGWKRKTYRGILTAMIRELQEALEVEHATNP
jgi:hypothetical protein